MKPKLLLTFILYLVIQCSAISQSNKQLINLQQQADDYYSLEEYMLALPIYEQLDSLFPNSSYFKYRLGMCYYNSHHKVKCLPYFLKAKEIGFIEPDINFYIGRGYHLNHEFDKALSFYKTFKALPHTDTLLVQTLDRFIAMCKVGKELMADSLELSIENMGPVINSKYPDYGPVVSADETVMIFTSRRPDSKGEKKDPEDNMYYEDVYITYKDSAGNWSIPEDMGPHVNSRHHDASVGISPDGQKLFLYRSGGKTQNIGDVYVSNLEGNNWSAPVLLADGINSENWEPSATITADEKTIFFSSDRPGGYGGIDLYVTRLQPDGHWGTPENLGPTINTPFDEDAPYIHYDNKTLFFSSTGHKTMGGFDIFTSIYNEHTQSWSEPDNIGYPINTADDDIYFMWSSDGTEGYFSSWREDSYGEKDIYVIHRPKGQANLIVLKGNVLNNETQTPIAATLTITDLESEEIVGVYNSNSQTGKYTVVLPHGKNYSVTIDAPGYLFYSENFNIPENHPFFNVKKNITLSPVKVGNQIVLNNIFFDFDKTSIKKESAVELEKIYDFLQENPDLKVEISGHTDSRGHGKYNQKLSEKRAFAVVHYLIKRGISKERLVAKGYGEFYPVAGNESEAGRQLNRRSELKIIDKDKNLIKYYKNVEIEYVTYGNSKSSLNTSDPSKSAHAKAVEEKRKSRWANSYWGEDGPPVNSILRPKVHFLQNDAKTITDYSKQRILNVVKAMEVYGGMKVQIMAYEDTESKSVEEKELSKKRAQTVLEYMIKQGVDASRLSIATAEVPNDKPSINTYTGKPEIGKVEFIVVGYDK